MEGFRISAGDGHPLLLPAGEVFHRLLQLVRQPDLSQDRGGLFGPLPSDAPSREAARDMSGRQAFSTFWMADRFSTRQKS